MTESFKTNLCKKVVVAAEKVFNGKSIETVVKKLFRIKMLSNLAIGKGISNVKFWRDLFAIDDHFTF